jgi:hypothetical protein
VYIRHSIAAAPDEERHAIVPVLAALVRGESESCAQAHLTESLAAWQSDANPALPRPLPPSALDILTWSAKPAVSSGFRGADARIRTADPFITSEVLYQLSYVGGGREV